MKDPKSFLKNLVIGNYDPGLPDLDQLVYMVKPKIRCRKQNGKPLRMLFEILSIQNVLMEQ